jgi:hypothetical protein
MGDAEGGFAGHRRNEVFLGGVWMPMDATIAAYDAAVTHINVTNLDLILGKASFKLVEAQWLGADASQS